MVCGSSCADITYELTVQKAGNHSLNSPGQGTLPCWMLERSCCALCADEIPDRVGQYGCAFGGRVHFGDPSILG